MPRRKERILSIAKGRFLTPNEVRARRARREEVGHGLAYTSSSSKPSSASSRDAQPAPTTRAKRQHGQSDSNGLPEPSFTVGAETAHKEWRERAGIPKPPDFPDLDPELTQAKVREADYGRRRAALLDRIARASSQAEIEKLRDHLDELDASCVEWFPTLYPPTGGERASLVKCRFFDRCHTRITREQARIQFCCDACLPRYQPGLAAVAAAAN